MLMVESSAGLQRMMRALCALYGFETDQDLAQAITETGYPVSQQQREQLQARTKSTPKVYRRLHPGSGIRGRAAPRAATGLHGLKPRVRGFLAPLGVSLGGTAPVGVKPLGELLAVYLDRPAYPVMRQQSNLCHLRYSLRRHFEDICNIFARIPALLFQHPPSGSLSSCLYFTDYLLSLQRYVAEVKPPSIPTLRVGYTKVHIFSHLFTNQFIKQCN